LGDRPGNVLTSLSSGFFRNEEEREMGFRSAMRARWPGRTLVEIAEGQGLDATQYDLVRAALDRDPEIRAVYSIGGGNIATLSAVLHHDLRQDLREACHIVMRAHGALPPAGPTLPSAIQVVTPYNMPPGALT